MYTWINIIVIISKAVTKLDPRARGNQTLQACIVDIVLLVKDADTQGPGFREAGAAPVLDMIVGGCEVWLEDSFFGVVLLAGNSEFEDSSLHPFIPFEDALDQLVEGEIGGDAGFSVCGKA